MRRRGFVMGIAGSAAFGPLVVHAQQGGRSQSAIPVIGFISDASGDSFPDRLRAFRQGLSAAGYIEGRNIKIEYQWAHGHDERLPEMADDLVKRHVSVIAAIGGPPQALAAKGATAELPIVFQIGGDPVAIGLVKNLARPGGNMTGVTSMNVDIASKRLELLHEIVPGTRSMALLVNPNNSVNARLESQNMQKAAQVLGLELHIINASNERDFDTAFTTVKKLQAGGLLFGADPVFTSAAAKLAALTMRDNVPAISPYPVFALDGGLMSYGGDIAESWRLAGVYVGRVLNGQKPGELPVEQSSRFEFVINLKTAKTMKIELPPGLLAIADKVIE